MNKPIVWTIAGSDSVGGAGIQADIKTINGLGAYGASVITAITAQNTVGVDKIEAVRPDTIKAQLNALKEDVPPQAVKLGMLYSAKAVEVIAEMCEEWCKGLCKGPGAYVVCDPVLSATSGDALAEPDFIKALVGRLFPIADMVTPNLDEAHRLLGVSIGNYRELKEEKEEKEEYIEQLANKLLALGPKSVLIKRGHDQGPFSQDYWTNGDSKAWVTSLRQMTRHTHGTGCTLSAAIAASVALGYSELDAIVIAKAYVNQGMRLAPGVGKGQGPLGHYGWPEYQDDLPWLTITAAQGRTPIIFPNCGSDRLGFYPIVDSYAWLERLLPLGVRTIQLRIKNALSEESLEEEIAKSISYVKRFQCRLFINDHWQLAIKLKAYGVHLGQEDLETADLTAIAQAGLRLGVSTHSYSEVARALALNPSYIAIGPIFSTTSKELSAKPQGIAAFKRWRRSLRCPLVAIGGIDLHNAPELFGAGADGIAVIRDIVSAPDIAAQVKAWLVLAEEL